MGALRTREEARFWEVVGGLQWRLDDSGGGPPPTDRPEFYRGGGGGAWPTWATHMIAFLLGGLVWAWLLLAPMVLPLLALGGLVAFVAVAVRRRWR